MKTKKRRPEPKPYDDSRDEVRLVCVRGYVAGWNEPFWIFTFTPHAYEARLMSGVEARRVIAADAKLSKHEFRVETVTIRKF
jgi:hypothetical protein